MSRFPSNLVPSVTRRGNVLAAMIAFVLVMGVARLSVDAEK